MSSVVDFGVNDAVTGQVKVKVFHDLFRPALSRSSVSRGSTINKPTWIVPGTLLSTILSFPRAYFRSRLFKVTRPKRT